MAYSLHLGVGCMFCRINEGIRGFLYVLGYSCVGCGFGVLIFLIFRVLGIVVVMRGLVFLVEVFGYYYTGDLGHFRQSTYDGGVDMSLSQKWDRFVTVVTFIALICYGLCLRCIMFVMVLFNIFRVL